MDFVFILPAHNSATTFSGRKRISVDLLNSASSIPSWTSWHWHPHQYTCCVSKLVVQWHRQPSSVHEIMGLNPKIIHSLNFVLSEFILTYTDIYQDIPIYLAIRYISVYTRIWRNMNICTQYIFQYWYMIYLFQLGIYQYIPVYLGIGRIYFHATM